jgi:acyl-CoA reductase-like NAD-dependent aldehyde dehydrogenase
MNIGGIIINGTLEDGQRPLDVANPATGEVAGRVAGATVEDADRAVAAAKAALAHWSGLSFDERARLIAACADIIDANAEELARLLTLEQGKPLNGLGSRYELGGCSAWTRHTATLRLPVDVIQDDDKAHISVHRQPLGVVLSVTPWNWPLMIAIWHIMPAMLAGNTVVIKPSSLTPLSTMRMVELLQQALPPGVLNAVAGTGDLGPALNKHPDIAKIAFTGSTPTGSTIMQAAAPTLKRLTLELGGNDAGIVLPDCDPAAIAEGLFWGAFINNGQTCGALKRLYVHDQIYDAVCEALVAFSQTVKVGDGFDENALLGPVQNRNQLEVVKRLVDGARASGGRVLTGGTPGDGNFYPITLVADATDDMDLVKEEQFGPALPILRYTDIEDAITRANSADEGLGGSIWSTNSTLARQLALRLQCGTTWINKHGTIRPDTPFGGIKASGFGVEFGEYGLEEFCALHVVHD